MKRKNPKLKPNSTNQAKRGSQDRQAKNILTGIARQEADGYDFKIAYGNFNLGGRMVSTGYISSTAISKISTWPQVFLFVLCGFIVSGCSTPSKESQFGTTNEVIVSRRPSALVLMTDFGTRDGAVSAMRGVAFETAPQVAVHDLTHEIPPFDIWEGAYRLQQTYKYWPEGTVFVGVVDPGVGSQRRSIVAKTRAGQYFVGPDNGLLTLLLDEDSIETIRQLDEGKQRLKGSAESYTFHGRDLYVYVGARLAGGVVRFEELGERVATAEANRVVYQKPEIQGESVVGLIPVLDPNFGNVWTNITKQMLLTKFGRPDSLQVVVSHRGKKIYSGRLPLRDSFAGVPTGQPLLYYNSLLNLSLAINMGDFAHKHKIKSGVDWTVKVTP